MTMRIGGVVLCGGKSSRMGYSKAMLPFGPELMLQRVVRLLSEVVSPIVVVAAPTQELPEFNPQSAIFRPSAVPQSAIRNQQSAILLARDEREGRGPLEGLLAGLSPLVGMADAAYVTSCDVPLLDLAFVRHMLAALGDHDIAVPVEEKFQHPLAAVYRTSVVPHIADLLAHDQLRPVFLFDRVNTLRVPIDELRQVDPELRTLANLNRPSDYFAAVELAGFTVPEEVRSRLM